MRSFFTPRWTLSHLFVLSMVVFMVNLGFWQLGRLDDRKESNSQIRAAMLLEPADFAELLDADIPPVDNTPTFVSGTYDTSSEVLIANRTFDSQAGSWIVTPLRLDDGRQVAVVRGWVPRLWVAGSDGRDAGAPTGRVEITGLAFASSKGGRVADDEVSGFPELNRMDTARITEVTGFDIEPTWVKLETQDPAAAELPAPVQQRPLDDGPHLSYAMQWFFFSSATVVVYYLILRRKWREVAAAP